MQGLSVPAKAFVLGEYAVLGGLPAVVATFGPRFGLRVRAEAEEGARFDPRSPAGLLAARAEPPIPADRYVFDDPFAGVGGFGASTAQFALLYMTLAQEEGARTGPASREMAHELAHELEWYAAWELYREVTAAQPLPPSGADLIAQWRGGVCAFDPAGEYFSASHGNPACADLWEAFDWTSVLVFSAAGQSGRKVNTHEHLAMLSKMGVVPQARAAEFPEMRGFLAGLRDPLFRGIDAIRGNDIEGLGRAMNAYGDELARLGLESRDTAADRRALGKLKGVLGAKGTGAMQADAILLVMPPLAHRERQAAVQAAEARGLKLVADGLSFQVGASAHH